MPDALIFVTFEIFEIRLMLFTHHRAYVVTRFIETKRLILVVNADYFSRSSVIML